MKTAMTGQKALPVLRFQTTGLTCFSGQNSGACNSVKLNWVEFAFGKLQADRQGRSAQQATGDRRQAIILTL